MNLWQSLYRPSQIRLWMHFCGCKNPWDGNCSACVIWVSVSSCCASVLHGFTHCSRFLEDQSEAVGKSLKLYCLHTVNPHVRRCFQQCKVDSLCSFHVSYYFHVLGGGDSSRETQTITSLVTATCISTRILSHFQVRHHPCTPKSWRILLECLVLLH